MDWVLFDLKQGYCNYYASAMVVMLRTMGIPARMAAGFAQGTWNSDEQAFVVEERDAHTWVEVYFPGYGWVEFEPTAAQAPLNRGDEPRAARRLSRPTAADRRQRRPSRRSPTNTPETPLDNAANTAADARHAATLTRDGHAVDDRLAGDRADPAAAAAPAVARSVLVHPARARGSRCWRCS